MLDYLKTKYAAMDAKDAAQALYDDGYRQVSRRHCLIARVDVSDTVMMMFFIKENFGDADSGVPSLPVEKQREHYRRVHSQDRLSGVPEPVLARLRRM